MARNGVCALLLLSIATASAFQALIPCSRYEHAHALERARAPQASRHRRSAYSLRCKALPRAAGMAAPAAHALNVFVQPEQIPSKLTAMSRSSLLGGAVFLAAMKVIQLSSELVAAPAGWTLFAHGLAGMLGGLAALFGDKALSVSFGESRGAIQGLSRSIKFTAITKAVNSVTFAYVQEAAAAFGAGSIMLGAAGSGVVFTMVQGLFTHDHASHFQENVMRNVLVMEAFWLTYAGLCALSPAVSVSYVGVAISGAVSGIASSVAAKFSWKPVLEGGVRGALAKMRQGIGSLRKAFKSACSARSAMQSSILFVVYTAVFNSLVI